MAKRQRMEVFTLPHLFHMDSMDSMDFFAFPWTFVDFVWTCYGLFFLGETYCKMQNFVHRKSTESPQKVHKKSTESPQYCPKSMDFLLKSPQVHGKSMDKVSMDVLMDIHSSPHNPWKSMDFMFCGDCCGEFIRMWRILNRNASRTSHVTARDVT